MPATELLSVSWSPESQAEAMIALGLHTGLLEPNVEIGPLTPSCQPTPGQGGHPLPVADVAARLGLDATAIQFDYRDARAMLRRTAPALMSIATPSGPRLLLVTGHKRARLKVLAPNLKVTSIPLESVRLGLCAEMEATQMEMIDKLLDETKVRDHRRERARDSLLEEFLTGRPVKAGWILRPAGDAPISRQFRAERLAGPLAVLMLGYVAAFLLWLVSWWLMGQGFLSGYLDKGWLTAWGLTLCTLIPIRMLVSYAGGLFSARAGAFLKRRLLFGALRLEPDEIRHLGMGQLLGQAMEVETVEQMAVTGGFLAVTALIQLAISAGVIGLGAGGGWQLALFGAWLVASVALAGHYLRHRRSWTVARLALTHDLVEGMVGHRTRAVQGSQENRTAIEDQALEHYHRVCLDLDRAALWLQVVLPRGWFITGLAGLAPAFVTGGTSLTDFAIGLGGLLLAYQAFHFLADGLERLIAAWVGWETLRPLWQAAARPVALGDPALAGNTVETSCHSGMDRRNPEVGRNKPSPAGVSGKMTDPMPETVASRPYFGLRQNLDSTALNQAPPHPLIECHNLGFRHAGRSDPVLQKLNLRIHRGEKILLQGPSGGGKSTLAMILAGQREPTEGLCAYWVAWTGPALAIRLGGNGW